MSRGYSLDLRERVIALVAEGMSKSAAGRHLRIAESSAIKWCKRLEETGSLAENPGRKLAPSPLDAHADWLLAFVERRSDATLAEIVVAIREERGVSITDSSISRFFQRRGVTYKKNAARQRATAGRRRRSPRGMAQGATHA
jgi:transposase